MKQFHEITANTDAKINTKEIGQVDCEAGDPGENTTDHRVLDGEDARVEVMMKNANVSIHGQETHRD